MTDFNKARKNYNNSKKMAIFKVGTGAVILLNTEPVIDFKLAVYAISGIFLITNGIYNIFKSRETYKIEKQKLLDEVYNITNREETGKWSIEFIQYSPDPAHDILKETDTEKRLEIGKQALLAEHVRIKDDVPVQTKAFSAEKRFDNSFAGKSSTILWLIRQNPKIVKSLKKELDQVKKLNRNKETNYTKIVGAALHEFKYDRTDR